VTCHNGTLLGSHIDPIANAQQAPTNVRCTAWITKGSKGTSAPTYRGRKTQYGSNKEIVTDF
jgi:hypothetical protein